MPELSNEQRIGNATDDVMENGEPNYEQLDRDLNVLFQLSNALIDCFKAAFDANGNVRTQQPSRELDIITFHTLDGDGITTSFPLANEIDIATELIGFATVNSVRQFTPADYSFTATTLDFVAAPAVGVGNIEYAIIQNTAGIIDRIEDVTAGLGAYLVGFPDDDNLFDASTAGDALTEVMVKINTLIADIGLISDLLRADGSVALTNDWEANLRKANGTAVAATGVIEVSGTPLHLDTFTIFDGIIGVGNTFQFTSSVINASGSLEFTGVPTAGDTVELEDVEGTTITFEFYANGGPDTSAPANTGVMLGVDAAETEANFRNAINVANIKITASLGAGTTTDLDQDLPGTAGNTTITVVGSNMTKTDFTGGLDETVPGNIPVVIEALAEDTAENIAVAVNGSLLAVGAVHPAASDLVNITHDVPGAIGNRLITQSGAGLTLSGMGGGVNGLLGDLCAAFRIRNLPPSVRDGDVVVHEQLQSLLSVIETFADLFLLLDGSSIMNGIIRMGGNKIIDVADGEDAADAVNKGQLDAVEALLARFIPVLGREDGDYGAQGEVTGPFGLGQAATDTADADQTAGPVAVRTIDGIPLPGAPDHVANRQHVTNVQALLQAQITALDVGTGGGGGNKPDGNVRFGSSLNGCLLDGSGLGSPVADINGGGIFNFEGLSVVAAQTPTEDVAIFCDGDININNDITMASNRKLEINAAGSITIDAAAAISAHDISMRAGGSFTMDGDLTAHGDIRLPTEGNGQPSSIGLAGFVYLSAGQAFNMGATGSITTMFCNIQAGANSVLAGTITCYLNNGRGIGGNGTVMQGGTGPTFGKDVGFLLGSNKVSAFAQASAAHDYDESVDLGYAYAPCPYAGEGGRGSWFGDEAGGGGAGGTAGGDGGNGDGGVPGGDSFARGSYRPYLFPMCPGGGGGGGTNVAGQDGDHGGRQGGAVVIYVNGDIDATGFIINVNGQAGQENGAGTGSGGGGAGAARVVSAGTITDGTINANGGAGRSSSSDGGGGGGGGSAHMIAEAFAGTQTLSTSGGGGGDGGAAGQSGTQGVIIMPVDEITCLAAEGYWSR